MANKLEISLLNSIYYREIISTQAEQYNSRHIDSFLFSDTILPWQHPACFVQPWQFNDTIRQQVISNLGPITTRFYPHTEGPYIEVAFVRKQEDKNIPGRFIYESNYSAFNLPEGFYRPVLTVAGAELWEGEWQWIRPEHTESLLLEYYHTEKKLNFHFQASGMVPSVRTFGKIGVDKFEATDVIYTDEEENAELLNSVSWDISELYINDSKGTATAWAKKLIKILGCNELKIDGRFYVKAAEGAAFERIDSEDSYNAKHGWSIDLRERLNKDSFTSIDDIQATRQAAVVYNVGLRGFGPGTTDAQTGTLISYE